MAKLDRYTIRTFTVSDGTVWGYEVYSAAGMLTSYRTPLATREAAKAAAEAWVDANHSVNDTIQEYVYVPRVTPT